MTVGELIAELQKCDPKAEVKIWHDIPRYAQIRQIRSAEQTDFANTVDIDVEPL